MAATSLDDDTVVMLRPGSDAVSWISVTVTGSHAGYAAVTRTSARTRSVA
jgi:hypothetical protein